MTDPAIIQRLDRMERLIKALLKEKKKTTWVKATEIMTLTGWNKEAMRRMRVNGVIDFKHDDKGWWYDLNSVPVQFIRHENTDKRGFGMDVPLANANQKIG